MKHTLSQLNQTKTKIKGELIIIGSLTIVALGVALTLDAAERLITWYEHRSDYLQIDEFIIALLILALGFTIFIWRRWRELRQSETYIHSLLRISKQMEQARTHAQIVEIILTEIEVMLGYKNAWLILLHEDGEYFSLLSAQGSVSRIVNEQATILPVKDDPFLQEIVTATHLVLVKDARIDPRTDKKMVAALGNRTIINVPIILSDRRIGVFGTGSFGDEGVKVPTSGQLDYLAALATHVAVALDRIQFVAEREQAAESLRASQELFKITLLNAPVSMLLADLKGHFWQVNEASCQMLGYSEEELLTLDFWVITHPDDLAISLDFVRRALAGEFDKIEYEKRYLHRDGRTIWATTNIYLVRDARGQPQYFIGQIQDISERKQAEAEILRLNADLERRVAERTAQLQAEQQALRQQEQHYHSLFEDSPIALWEQDFSQVKIRFEQLSRDKVTDFEQYFDKHPEAVAHFASLVRVLDVNIAAVKLQQAASKAELLGSLSNILQPSASAHFRQELLTIAAGRVKYENEATNCLPSGQIIHYRVGWSVAPGYEADFSRVVTYVFDITDLKQAEAQLHQYRDHLEELVMTRTAELNQVNQQLQQEIAERKQTESAWRETTQTLQTLIQASPLAVNVLDPDGMIRLWNPAAERMFGWSEAEVVGRPVPHVPEDQQAEFAALLIPQMRGEILKNVEVARLHKDGSRVEVSLWTAPLYDTQGQITGLMGMLADITERKQAEKTLQRTHFTMEHMADAVYWIDPQARIIDVNKAACLMLGYTRAELLNLSVPDIDPRYTLHQQPNFRQQLKQASTLTFETQHRTKEGRDVSVEVVANFIEFGDQQLNCALARDITERKQAEEKIKASLQEKEVMLKEIHHRVKNNLQVVSSLLDLQANYLNDEAARKIFLESQQRIRSMALIHERLYQSKDLAHINFVEYVENLTGYLLHSYGDKQGQVKIRNQIAPISLNIEIAIPCGLIINELVSNALKHAFPADQGGEIRVQLHMAAENQLVLTIKDNGVGLSAGLDLRQARSLGLKLVVTLVKQLKGTIVLQGQPETTFKIKFTLPSLENCN